MTFAASTVINILVDFMLYKLNFLYINLSFKIVGDDKFCGGLDINIIQKVHKKGDTSHLPDASVELVIDTIENGKKPSVAAIQGFALGGGLELAMGCSTRIATSRAELGLPELKLGLIPGCGACQYIAVVHKVAYMLEGTQRLPRLVGTSKAIEMLMSSKIITSEEGKELGIINDVVSSEDLLTVSRLWALDIAEGRKTRTNTLQRMDKIEPIHESSAILEVARQQVLKTSRSMPHYKACLDVIEEGIISGGYAGVLKGDVTRNGSVRKENQSKGHVRGVSSGRYYVLGRFNWSRVHICKAEMLVRSIW
ncbi:hypothetical protein HAX54_018488 [Datura stramonium]|uniref:Uncharacterized protein n=1 Tax=Datura stramonium TaxID=4076 RepID=A0ABS8UPG2_DATST|nr:hypothetical protein [Datura stramonium]